METRQSRLKTSLLISGLMALLVFAVFYLGVGVLLGTPLLVTNILAMAILGLILGSVAFILFFFGLYYAFGLYAGGFLAGSALMVSAFWQGVAGWEDLVGLLSFFFLVGMGLAAGLLVQLLVYLVKKYRTT